MHHEHEIADFGTAAEMNRFASPGDYWKDRAMRAEKSRDSFKAQSEWLAERCDALADSLRECLIDLRATQKNATSAAKTDPRWDGVAEAIQPRIDDAETRLHTDGGIKPANA